MTSDSSARAQRRQNALEVRRGLSPEAQRALDFLCYDVGMGEGKWPKGKFSPGILAELQAAGLVSGCCLIQPSGMGQTVSDASFGNVIRAEGGEAVEFLDWGWKTDATDPAETGPAADETTTPAA